MSQFKVGDVLRHRYLPGIATIIARHRTMLFVDIENYGPNLWAVEDTIPPKPTVVWENWVNCYRGKEDNYSVGYSTQQLSKFYSRLNVKHKLHIQHLSDGTWTIEEVK